MGAWGGDSIAATLHEVGVNMGDHGETIIRAMEVDENESVGALMQRLIPTGSKYLPRKYENFVTLRFVMPAADHDHEQDVANATPEPF